MKKQKIRLNEVINKILSEFALINQQQTQRIWKRQIMTDTGHIVFVSQAILDYIYDLAVLETENKNEAPPFVANFKDLQKACSNAVATALLQTQDVQNSTRNKLFRRTYKSFLKAHFEGQGKRVFVFGVHFFSTQRDFTIELGGVKLQHREQWLWEAKEQGYLSSKQTSDIDQFWNNKSSISSLSLGKEIANATCDAEYILSVPIDGFDKVAGYERALFAARICIALWCLLLSDRPEKFLSVCSLTNDRPSQFRTRAFLSQESEFAREKDAGSIGIDSDNWMLFCQHNPELISFAASLLRFIVSSKPTIARNRLFLAFAHSLMWFYKGCNEEISPIAVSNLGACLDAIGEQNGRKGIGARAEGVFGQNLDAPFLNYGFSFQELIDAIYHSGRNATFHGSNRMLFKDWSLEKNRAIAFCFELLRKAISLAAHDIEIDCTSKLIMKKNRLL
ncbi:hypothetical protein [Pseudovibrio sp. Ad37]|uniref:hypothetical protein n=1 Tax=Pseudovibrio sp. Ad37 TaxID=989422 RepID=UPI0007AE722C|nr:hypothetical protein [Pseudovibrio sp. Ad37]KZL28774.1 hypothetical protein PsAD37_00562 [Pseudovibrio sp. Ad37]